MQHIILRTMQHSSSSHELGHTLMRVGVGIMFIIFGYQKLTSGAEHLTELGSAMGLFGITFGYLFWGYAAALTELCVGICYTTGFLTRLASIPFIWLLIVAITFHIHKGDTFTKWGFAFTCLCIALNFLIAGSGKYSVDHLIENSHK